MNAMAQVAQRMTADEYLAMPFDEQRTELVEGEVVVVHLPRNLHQVVLMDLVRALDRWARAQSGRGSISLPLDVKVDEYNVAVRLRIALERAVRVGLRPAWRS